MWGAAGVVPELAVELWETLAEKGDLIGARELWRHLWAISDFLESVNYVAGVKAGLELHRSSRRTAAAADPAAAGRPHRRRSFARPSWSKRRRSPLASADAAGMSTASTLEAIEVHAEGEPGRVITSAAGLVRGRHDGRAVRVLPRAASTGCAG